MVSKVVKLLTVNAVIYLLFSFFYIMLYKSDPKNFVGAEGDGDLFYFAMVSHTTTGYGDILPKTPMAKFVVWLHLGCVLVFSLLTIFEHA